MARPTPVDRQMTSFFMIVPWVTLDAKSSGMPLG
jgi:hypothetical protein